MRKGTLSVVLAACMMGFNAGAARAETVPPAPVDHEVRVVNGHATAVRVYVQDAQGGLYMLGQVAAADFKVMTVPAELAAKGQVQIKVYPETPFGALSGRVDGIQSHTIQLKGFDALNMYVEHDLLRSVVEIARG